MKILTLIASMILNLILIPAPPPSEVATLVAPAISGINSAETCHTSVLINFVTSTPSHAYLEYGPTTSYGLATIDDPVRLYKEHAIQLTSLTPSVTYHYRVVATDSTGTIRSGDQAVTTVSSNAVCRTQAPEVDSRMPSMTGAVDKTVKASGGDFTPAQFQNALNEADAANEKRFITVDAGLTVIGRMPVNADRNQIIIRSSRWAELPEGQRVMMKPNGEFDSSQAAKMFRMANTTTEPAVDFAPGSRNIRLIGAEITIEPSAIPDAPDGHEQGGLVQMQANVSGKEANLPRFIGIDRCYIHGLPTKNTRRGIYMLGEDIFVIDSFVSDFHATGGDAQAILAVDLRRGKIHNSTLISSGENFMWGGTGQGVPGYVIGGLEFTRNHLYEPISWKKNGPSFNGIDWKEKNLFEIKTGAKLLMAFNYLGGVTDAQGGYWVDAQSMAINIKLEQNSTGPGTCELMEDLTFYKNFGKNLHAGVAVIGRTTSSQGCTNIPDRILFKDNVFELDAVTWDVEPGAAAGSFNAGGWMLSGTANMEIVHNTTINSNPTSTVCNSVYGDGSLLLLGDAVTNKWSGFKFRNNITDFRGCGVAGGGALFNATTSLNGVYAGWIFDHNGIVRAAGAQANFPEGQFWALAWSTQLVNFNNGRDGNYRVAPGSSWENKASDGRNLGADVDGVERGVEFTPSGLWTSGGSSPTPTPTPSPTPMPSPTPSPTPSTESPNNTRVPPATQIVDSTGAIWTRNADGTILRNGAGTSGAGSQILYCNRAVYAFGTDNQWYRWSNTWSGMGPVDPCGGTPTPTPSPSPSPTPSPNPTPTPSVPVPPVVPPQNSQTCTIGSWCYWSWPNDQAKRVATLNNAVTYGCDAKGPFIQTGSYVYCMRVR